jgi:hypothetical protein
MSAPQIIISGDGTGYHNADLIASAKRIKASKVYKDVSTICVIPTRGMIPARVVESWWNMLTPMNQKFLRMMIRGMEVGDAYNAAIETILANEALSSFKYVLTLEEDNIPPPDGLLKLIESMNEERHYAAIGGLYWTKGPEGMPMCYGNPAEPLTFNPQIPVNDSINECNGLGMGFTLFRTEVFRDEKIPRPWFKTSAEWSQEEGSKLGTQDLHFFSNARKAGYRVACDTRVKVGHYSHEEDMIW